MPSIRDRIVELRRVRAGDLAPSPRNWRTHGKIQRAALEGILAEVGYAGALLAREVDGKLELIDGHLRASLDPEQQVPVLVLDVTREESDKLLATLDPIAALASRNDSALKELLAKVETQDAGLATLLEQLGRSYEAAEESADAEEAARESRATGTKRGDLWRMGEHRLLCGDSTVATDVERVLGGEKPALMVTDPPYGIEYDPGWRKVRGAPGGKVATGTVKNDDRADWREAWALFPGSTAYVWCDSLHLSEVEASLLACKFVPRSLIIGVKQQAPISRGHYHWRHETCWYAVRGSTTWYGGRKQTTVWEFQSPIGCAAAADDDGASSHSTRKPVEIFERPILNHTRKGESVYEPFSGSGTCIMAAERSGRRCFAIELDPGYCDEAVARWERTTGSVAERLPLE